MCGVRKMIRKHTIGHHIILDGFFSFDIGAVSLCDIEADRNGETATALPIFF